MCVEPIFHEQTNEKVFHPVASEKRAPESYMKNRGKDCFPV